MQAANEQDKVKELATHRAALTPYLVQWAERNTNPDIHKFTYRYRVFDAATQKLAATLEQDPAARAKKLQDVLNRYQELQSPENTKLYQASLPPGTPAEVVAYADPAVVLGLGDTAFELGDWKTVHDTYGQLLRDSKLGDGIISTRDEAGQLVQTDNDQYWEAQYKYVYATAKMVNDPQLSQDPKTRVDPETPKTMIGQLFAAWGDHAGGKKWHDKFVDLARDLGVAAPTTQPVAVK